MTCKFPASSGYFNCESKPGRSGLALPFQEASERCEPQASEVLLFLPCPPLRAGVNPMC